jgi:hypothetical protein
LFTNVIRIFPTKQSRWWNGIKISFMKKMRMSNWGRNVFVLFTWDEMRLMRIKCTEGQNRFVIKHFQLVQRTSKTYPQFGSNNFAKCTSCSLFLNLFLAKWKILMNFFISSFVGGTFCKASSTLQKNYWSSVGIWLHCCNFQCNESEWARPVDRFATSKTWLAREQPHIFWA